MKTIMSTLRTTGRRVTRGAIASLAIGLYAVLLTAGSLEHHDLACHLKSRTHCTTCVFASVPDDGAGVADAIGPLPVVALVGPAPAERALAGTTWVLSDRAPPAC